MKSSSSNKAQARHFFHAGVVSWGIWRGGELSRGGVGFGEGLGAGLGAGLGEGLGAVLGAGLGAGLGRALGEIAQLLQSSCQCHGHRYINWRRGGGIDG